MLWPWIRLKMKMTWLRLKHVKISRLINSICFWFNLISVRLVPFLGTGKNFLFYRIWTGIYVASLSDMWRITTVKQSSRSLKMPRELYFVERLASASYKVTTVVDPIASKCKNLQHATSATRCRNCAGMTKFHYETKKYVEFTRFSIINLDGISGLQPQSPRHSQDNFQRESHIPYSPPTSVTWLQFLRKQNNNGTSTALAAETYWSTRTWLRAYSRLVTST
jgi:hypothetical protein